jgi:hypothetical protein
MFLISTHHSSIHVVANDAFDQFNMDIAMLLKQEPGTKKNAINKTAYASANDSYHVLHLINVKLDRVLVRYFNKVIDKESIRKKKYQCHARSLFFFTHYCN